VERLGKYHRTLRPGLNIIVPYIDRVAYKILTKDQPIEVDDLEAITKDNAVVVVNAISFIKVSNPQEASYGVQNYVFAIQNLVMTTLRAIIGGIGDRRGAVQPGDDQGEAERGGFPRDRRVGITVKSAEVRDNRPSQSMQEAMESRRRPTDPARDDHRGGREQAGGHPAGGRAARGGPAEAEAQDRAGEGVLRRDPEIADAIGDGRPPPCSSSVTGTSR
jgi:regulator of protease activity HflC (stomatin/prohibitin superfamily)